MIILQYCHTNHFALRLFYKYVAEHKQTTLGHVGQQGIECFKKLPYVKKD